MGDVTTLPWSRALTYADLASMHTSLSMATDGERAKPEAVSSRSALRSGIESLPAVVAHPAS